MDQHRRERLKGFVDWVSKNIRGDEKGESQLFLDRLMQAFGQPGLEVGQAEFRIKPDAASEGGTRFADFVWKPVVLIEMKKRGVDLARHAAQAFGYWTTLAPGRPKYVILCNFDELWVYDPDESIYEPADKLTIADLPEHYEALAFLFPTREEPKFRYNRVAVTRGAADHLAACFNLLTSKKRAVPPAEAQRFILQMLVALFSEDIGLLPKFLVTTLLDECTDPPTTFDLLGGLFNAMNTPRGRAGGRFKDVEYFNGGLFAQPTPLELEADEIQHLQLAAREYDWSFVSPDIFGTVFQHSLGAKDRHAFGAHYTSQDDILKIVRPTIVDPFTRLIERADTIKSINAVRTRLQSLRVLDPACGSGNFLYVAYREMRRLEADILRKENELSRKQEKGQTALGGVSPRQFFGLDILPFAVELAKVTLSIAPKLASDELHTTEPALPLANLDANIIARDALIDADGSPAKWPECDVIIGNPPFLGAKRLKPEHGADYVNAVRAAYPGVPGMADYCVYWFRKAHDHLPECTPDNPTRGRAGLVGTQNIRNNQSRVGGLDYIVANGGVIVDAVENQPWSGEASVHVSIANWVKAGGEESRHESLLIPDPRLIWTKADLDPSLFASSSAAGHKRTSTKGKRGRLVKSKSYELIGRATPHINSALSDRIDVSAARLLAVNSQPQRCFQGIVTGYSGFVVTQAQRARWLKAAPQNAEVVKPYMVGRDLVSGDGKPSRAVIDFGHKSVIEAQAFAEPFAHTRELVLPAVKQTAARSHGTDMEAARLDHLDRWWQFWNTRRSMRSAFKPLARFIAVSRVTKRAIFCFVCVDIAPDSKLQTFAFDDDFSFGVLQSSSHWNWFVAKCAKLTERFSYSPRSVFDTFPWPQSPTKKQIRAVAEAGRAVRRVRDEALKHTKGGLRALYRTLELPGKNPLKDAHAALDSAVLDAYGFSPRKDLLAQILALNLEVASREDRYEPVTAPGVPPSYGDPSDLITDDCIRP